MALAFTYRLEVTSLEPAVQPEPQATTGLVVNQALTAGDGSVMAPPSNQPAPPPLLAGPGEAPPIDLLNGGAICTNASESSHRPDSGLGFSCLDVLTAFAEVWP